MFKKKNNNKKIDLTEQAENITTTTPNPPSSPPPPPPHPKHKPNLFEINIQHLESIQQQKNTPFLPRASQIVQQKDMLDCFVQLEKIRKEMQIQGKIEQKQSAMSYDVDGGIGPRIERQSQREGKKKMVLVEQNLQAEYGSDNDMLQIEVDQDGGLSPFDHEEINVDYQNDLIRKILTKQNYQTLQTKHHFNLTSLNQQSHSDTLFASLIKLNDQKIKKKIDADLHEKTTYLSQVQLNLQQLTAGDQNKKKEIQTKQCRLKCMQDQMLKLQKVIQHIYYYGDSISQFSIDGIWQQHSQLQQKRNRDNIQPQDQVWQL